MIIITTLLDMKDNIFLILHKCDWGVYLEKKCVIFVDL